jgi:cell division ATPase FtsA
LLDFDSAENLKISLNKLEEHTFTDVIGMTHNYTTKEIIEKIKPKMIEVAEMIAKQILEYNEKIMKKFYTHLLFSIQAPLTY